MNKQDIVKALNKYQFDIDEYMVISGASMVLQGIKSSTGDIDIAVSKKYYDYLVENYDCVIEKVENGLNIYLIDDVINFSTNYYNRDEVIIYEGFPIQNLDGIKKLKLCLNREKDIHDINKLDKYLNLNPLVLAYLGDSIYEVYIRKYLIDIGNIKVNELQKEATKFVSAKSQSNILNKLIDNNILKPNELDIIRRGRNAKSHGAPKNTDIVTYKQATGFETLIGYLYLQNNINRINEIIKEIIGE